MNWKIEEKVFLAPLSELTFYTDDIYSPVGGEKRKDYSEDVLTNGQVSSAFITHENVIIGGLRLCRELIASGKTHVRVQRVEIEPKFIPAFRKSTNNYRHKTKLDDYREVQKILATIPRHQGKKDPESGLSKQATPPSQTTQPAASSQSTAPKPTISTQASEVAESSAQSPSAQIIELTGRASNSELKKSAPAMSVNHPKGEKPQESRTIPLSSSPSVGSITPPKKTTPIQQAIEEADNGMNSTEFQKIKYIEGIEKKYGVKLLSLLDTKCPNVDKVYKAAKEVESRNKQRAEKKPMLDIPVSECRPYLYNKSNWEMPEVKNNSIDFAFTSNAYWNQIDYLNPREKHQLGQEPTIEDFIEKLMKSFIEVYKKLAPTGNLFVNYRGTFDKHGNFVGEEEFVIAMRKIGFLYKGRFIWLKKGGGKRSGKRTRNPENCYEPVFWFTKTSDYYYRPAEISRDEPITVTFKSAETRTESKGVSVYDKIDVSIPFRTFKTVIEETEFLGVVEANSAASDSQFMNELYGKHPAPFPMALPLLFLLQFCPPQGRVLEPFLGRGAGLVSALMLGHTCYGYEIEREYYNQAVKLLADVAKDIDYYTGCMKEVEQMFDDKFNEAA